MPSLAARRLTAFSLGLALSLVLVSGTSVEADLKSFKKAWGAASKASGDAKREAQTAALGAIGAEDDVKLAKLLPSLALDSTLDYRVRDAAEDALSRLRGPAVDAWFSESLGAGGKKAREKRTARRVLLCHVLGRRAAKNPASRGVLIAALKDGEETVAQAALRGVREIKDTAVVGGLIELLSRAKGRLAADARLALKRITGERFASAAEWASFWEAKGASWDPSAAKATNEPEPAERRLSTRTRLEPPKGGTTIYGTVTSSKVLFVVDVSGSMQVRAQDTTDRIRTRLDYVRASLAGVIESQIEASDQFNVLSFSSDAKLFTKKKAKLLKGNAANKKKVAAWVQRLQPEDGTNVYLALERAFQIPGIDTIYFLSDGSPSEGTSIVTAEILGHVRRWNSGRGVRIHTIGFLVGDGQKLGIVQDKSMAKGFLEALAKNNDGSVRFFE